MEMVFSSQGCGQAPGSLSSPHALGKELRGGPVLRGRLLSAWALGPRYRLELEVELTPVPLGCEKQRARMQEASWVASPLGPACLSLAVPAIELSPVQCFNSECYCVDTEGQLFLERKVHLESPEM